MSQRMTSQDLLNTMLGKGAAIDGDPLVSSVPLCDVQDTSSPG